MCAGHSVERAESRLATRSVSSGTCTGSAAMVVCTEAGAAMRRALLTVAPLLVHWIPAKQQQIHPLLLGQLRL